MTVFLIASVLATALVLTALARATGFAIDLDWDSRDAHLSPDLPFTAYTTPQLRRALLRHDLAIKKGVLVAESRAYAIAINDELDRRATRGFVASFDQALHPRDAQGRWIA